MSANRRARKKEPSIAEKNFGVICGICLKYWRFLPPNIRNHYDAEDMISDVALHVVKQAQHYDPDRAKETTWVHQVATNCCRTIQSHYQTQQFSACETQALTEFVENYLPHANEGLKRREAIDAVERMIEFSSDDGRELLDGIFNGSVNPRLCHRAAAKGYWVVNDADAVLSLQRAVKRSGVTWEQIELVLRYALG